MKILLINSLYFPNLVGGAERFVQTLSESLVQAGHQVVVICTTPEKGLRTDWVSGVKVYYVGLKNLYWPFGDEENHRALKPLAHALETYNPWMAREATRILDAERPDIVHTNNLSGFSVSAWSGTKQRSLPLVHTLHDHYLLCPQGNMFRNGENCETRCVACFPYALPRGRSSNLVDAVVGVSRFILKRHLEFSYFAATPEKRVIPNSYEAQPHAAPSGERTPHIRFGYLNHLNANKGIELLLRNATRLPEGAWALNIAGKGFAAYDSRLRARHETPDVKFMGYVRPGDFFPEIDVLVAPSVLRESFGRTVIEAYAHGVPVIGSDRGGIPELIEEGSTGLLFDPDRPGDLAAKMRRFIENPAMIETMRPECLRKARGFLPENVVDEYLGLYADAIDNGRRRETASYGVVR